MLTSEGNGEDEGRVSNLVEAGIIDSEYPRYHEVFANLSESEEAILIDIKKRCDDLDRAEGRDLYPWRLPH